MNLIYQGKVTDVEIHVPANKEKPWQPFDPDPKQAKAKCQSARPLLSASIGERNKVRCRNPFNQLSALGYRSSVIGDSPKALDAVNSEIKETI